MTFPLLRKTLLALLAAALVLPAVSARAAQSDAYQNDDLEDQPASRVGRISKVEGEVSLRQFGYDEWQKAEMNAPVFEGDEFYTSDGARVEFQLGGGRYVRIDELTDIVFANLEPDAVRVEIPTGLAIVSLQKLDHDEEFEISAPAAAITATSDGVYRVQVESNGNTRVGIIRGNARVAGTSEAVNIMAGETADFNFDNPADYHVLAVVDSSSFDSWSEDLDTQREQYAAAAVDAGSLYNRTDIYGITDLNGYGNWVNGGSYGSCWVPSVGYGWSPYSNGSWNWYNGYGYTWISNDPWGWAPYHYGRWAFLSGYGWAWVPWSSFSGGSYAWYPGNAYWYQYPGSSNYYWVPLAPNEPYVAYVQANRRHHRDFVPEHLRAGRGIGVSLPGSGARLKPSGTVKGGGIGPGRQPVGISPSKPKDLTASIERTRPNISESIRTRPVVVGQIKPSAATLRRPVREAVKDTRERPAVSNGLQPTRGGAVEAGGTPTMIESRPAPRTSPGSNAGTSERSRDGRHGCREAAEGREAFARCGAFAPLVEASDLRAIGVALERACTRAGRASSRGSSECAVDRQTPGRSHADEERTARAVAFS